MYSVMHRTDSDNEPRAYSMCINTEFLPTLLANISPPVCVYYTVNKALIKLITFHVRCSPGEMYIGHGYLCVCVSAPRRIRTLLHGPGCNLREW